MARKIYAELRPAQRERLACFDYAVMIKNNHDEVIQRALEMQPDAMVRRRDLTGNRVYVHKQRVVLTKRLADAILFGMLADAQPVKNPNIPKPSEQMT